MMLIIYQVTIYRELPNIYSKQVQLPVVYKKFTPIILNSQDNASFPRPTRQKIQKLPSPTDSLLAFAWLKINNGHGMRYMNSHALVGRF